MKTNDSAITLQPHLRLTPLVHLLILHHQIDRLPRFTRMQKKHGQTGVRMLTLSDCNVRSNYHPKLRHKRHKIGQ